MTADASPEIADLRTSDQIVNPPTSIFAILRQIGPGLIIAANIVGSGELIMTTKTGDWKKAIVTALATFGIIGVGASELISYPYWCLEKGYARSAGPRKQDAAWLSRANGWFHVMKWDAFTSMVIYTLATAAFYLMGVAVLHAEGRNPDGMRMVSTLARSYVPIFGEYAIGH